MAYFSRMWEQFTDPVFLAEVRKVVGWIVGAAAVCIFVASIVRANRPSPYKREAEKLQASIRGMLQVFTGIASRR
jgi:hypothetical protein